MKINATLTISRNSEEVMNIRVVDRASRAQFVHIRMSPHDLMMALTGMSHIEVDAEVKGLSVVGMNKVIEDRRIAFPLHTSVGRDAMSEWLMENGKENGWIVDAYLGSQNSVFQEGGQTFLRYRVYRYEAADAMMKAREV